MAESEAQSTSAEKVNIMSPRIKRKKAEGDEDWSNWLEALAHCVKETPMNSLALGYRNLYAEKIQSILHILSNSQVTDLNLQYVNLTHAMAELLPLLIETKVSKLEVDYCQLTKEDLLLLAEVLKDSQITYLSLYRFSGAPVFNTDEGLAFICHLKNSKLTTLKAKFRNIFSSIPTTSCFEALLDTSITCLDLTVSDQNTRDLTFLFANLGNSAVTDLNVQNVKYLSLEALQELSRRLVETKIEKLNLSYTCLKDDALEILAVGLVNSKVTDLNISCNSFQTLRPLFSRLKETKIETLDVFFMHSLTSGNLEGVQCSPLVSLNLRGCHLTDEAGAEVIESLRFSNVKKLDISSNSIQMLTVKKFSEKVLDLNLEELDISNTPLPLGAFYILGKCLKQSKVIRISVNSIDGVTEAAHLFFFLKLTEGSSITHVEMGDYYNAWNAPRICETEMPVGTTFTEFNLYRSKIHDVSNLANFLKYSSITHLNLCSSKILDRGVVALAKCLKETEIRRLNLSDNAISSQGAIALALSLEGSNLLYLHLDNNKIGEDGLVSLATFAKNTFITQLDVLRNTGKRVLLVETVLWHNKVKVHKLVSFFEQIAPKKNDDKFCFDQSLDGSDVSAFLEKCMWFYKTVTDKPQAISVLLEGKVVSLSRGEITKLVSEEFPRQFSQFIACRIEADLMQHVSLLEKAETMGLVAIVESLLLNRPIFVIDKDHSILHPYVYKLLLKYKQPVCNLAVEPSGIMKIIEYFTEHADIEGAVDVTNSLRGANST